MGVEQATAHFESGDWAAAFDAWSAAGLSTLTTAELDQLATAAELVGRHDEAVRALHQAFVRCQEERDLRQAVRAAFRLSMTTAAHGESAIAAGWASRAEGLVEEIGDDVPERGWVALLRMYPALGSGALEEAGAWAAEATAAGRRHQDADLVAMGMCSQGRIALYAGRVTDGLTLLDEAMVRVIAGEASPSIAGEVFCTAIEGCQEISDFDRVAEWTSALERWCDAQPGLLAFTGQCAVHRGQLMKLHGDWAEALGEFELASRRYVEIGSPDAVGLAACEAGDVLRLRGEYDAADAAYQRAADHGFDPQPGLALLSLARGKVAAALGAVDRLLSESAGPVQRCRLLPGAVEVLIAAGELDRARSVADELGELAATFGSTSLAAVAAQAAGEVELASGEAAGALPHLRKAQQLWSRAGRPYDQARVRILTGRSLGALGDAQSSRREIEAGREMFRRLGATPAADEASALLAPAALPGGLTAREVEVLRLVATGRTTAQIASDLVLSEKTVSSHLSNIFGKLQVGSRSAATAYAFEHGLI